jgi:hypothetical protein
MKKLMMLAAMLALVVALAVPALAADRNGIFSNNNDNFDRNNDNGLVFVNDNGFNNGNPGVSQEIANEDETGNVDLSFSVQSSGNNSNQCVTPLQFGNTGSNQNAQGFLQYNSTADDLSGEGGDFTFAPVLSGGCDQAVQQSSAASSS